MVEDEAQADSPPRSPAPITVHVHAPESTHVKPALKTSNSQDEFDRDLGRPLSNMQFLNASNINKAHNHLDAIPSNESSILNDQEFQELQQALQLSLQEAREHAGHGPNHVSFVPKDEVIPSSGEPSETQDSVAGSVADYEECIAEAKRRTSSQLVVDADYYDEEEALLKAIEISRREFEEKLRGDDGIPAGCCSGRLADDCLGACGGACGSMQIVSEEEHDKHWKGKERAYY
ncbi:hypothetical protein BDR26DRAFT_858686 [Obelidium mucronatum]|nr:hypothetical protein BDR26DRAFT_858686 [Obelidium mucronatum]